MSEYQEIPIGQIRPPLVAARTVGDQERFDELVRSIRQHGILQPLLVRPYGDRYEIVAGHRRFMAAQIVALDTLPCVVREMTDRDVDMARLEENLKREDLNPVDEARYLAKMIDDHDLTLQDVCELIGKGRTYVTNRLSLLTAPKDIQEAIEQQRIPYSVGLQLARITDDKDREYYTHFAEQDGATARVVRRWAQDWLVRQEVMPEPMEVTEEMSALRQAGKSAWVCRYCGIEGHSGYLVSIWICDKCLRQVDELFNELARLEREIGEKGREAVLGRT